jgi:tetratricopeptide (TPR) repeat protein
VDRKTRHQLKQDEFRVGFEELEEYLKTHFKEIAITAAVAIVLAGLVLGTKYYLDRQETSSNIELSAAMKTFESYVGPPTPETAASDSFLTAGEKYTKALDQFNAIVLKYKMFPRPKAADIALYQAGVCESMLGKSSAAVQTLEEAGRNRDREIATLAQFALAGEYLKTGKTQEAVKIYQGLADHPSLSVPRATALLAQADADRDSAPAQARQIYGQVLKEFGSVSSVAEDVKQKMAGLPQ